MDPDERPSSATNITISNIKSNIEGRMFDDINNASTVSTSEKKLPSPLNMPSDTQKHTEDILPSPRTPDVPVQTLPKVNCPERIVICIDVSLAMNERRYRAKAGTAFSAMEIVKRALKLFINNKQMISNRSKKHVFALVLLLDEALWITDFTSDTTELFTQIESLEPLEQHADTVNMSTLFDLLIDKASVPLVRVSEETPPPYVVRVILIYGRSHCMPFSNDHESQNLMTGSPYYFMDIVYLHELPSASNQCEAIFTELCELDTRGFSHVFDISRTPTKVFDAFGKLLAHPLQRAVQSQWGHNLDLVPHSLDGD
ncbi:BRISC and BRCA1-A complex member 1-like [Watersipora subatra]|uniref:BRISC and BRCA1-A complex member 1-like n=1 Tax=Watersipora subatra TaxID=2589382 RepID=UPI00355C0F12